MSSEDILGPLWSSEECSGSGDLGPVQSISAVCLHIFTMSAVCLHLANSQLNLSFNWRNLLDALHIVGTKKTSVPVTKVSLMS